MIEHKQSQGYQRWNTPSLDSSGEADLLDQELIRQQAEAEGYAQGMERAKADIDSRLAQLNSLIDMFEAPLDSLEDQLMQRLINAVLLVSKAIVTDAVATDPALVKKLVEYALSQIHQDSDGATTIHVHPDDLPFVRAHLEQRDTAFAWELVPDSNLGRANSTISMGDSWISDSIESRVKSMLDQLMSAARNG
jgi:flagellar assembly protein FliH